MELKKTLLNYDESYNSDNNNTGVLLLIQWGFK